MVNKIKEYWFSGLIGIFMFLFIIFVTIVAIAPHNDEKERGFSKCTYEMSYELNVYGSQKKIWGIVGAIFNSYVCYINVMRDGFHNFIDGKQSTPWENYLFTPYTMEIDKELSEPLSEDLIKASKLNDSDGDVFDFSQKENDDDK